MLKFLVDLLASVPCDPFPLVREGADQPEESHGTVYTFIFKMGIFSYIILYDYHYLYVK